MSIRRIVPDIESQHLDENRAFYVDSLGLTVGMDMGFIVTCVSPSSIAAFPSTSRLPWCRVSSRSVTVTPPRPRSMRLTWLSFQRDLPRRMSRSVIAPRIEPFPYDTTAGNLSGPFRLGTSAALTRYTPRILSAGNERRRPWPPLVCL